MNFFKSKNEIKIRLEKYQIDCLQDLVDRYSKIMNTSNEFIEEYRNRDIHKMMICIDNINRFKFEIIDAVDKISKIEELITGKRVFADKNSLCDFITEKSDYIKFHKIESIDGTLAVSEDTYKKQFSVERPDFVIYDFNDKKPFDNYKPDYLKDTNKGKVYTADGKIMDVWYRSVSTTYDSPKETATASDPTKEIKIISEDKNVK